MGFSRQEYWIGVLLPSPHIHTAAAAAAAAAAAKSLQSCPTLCDRIDGSPPGSPVPGILQARTLEWAAIAFSEEVPWKDTDKQNVEEGFKTVQLQKRSLGFCF